MNKAELIANLASQSGVTQADAGRVLDAFITTVGDTLKAGDSIALVGFGTFQVTKKAARTGPQPCHWQRDSNCGKKCPSF